MRPSSTFLMLNFLMVSAELNPQSGRGGTEGARQGRTGRGRGQLLRREEE